MDINTCYETTKDFHTIATYSHLVPLTITVFLSIYVLVKTKFSSQAVIFTTFTTFFSLWLAGDFITWLSSNYDLVVTSWSQLDNINIIFFSLAAYFFATTIRNGNISKWEKLFLAIITLPGLYSTFTLSTAGSFDQAFCNVNNSDFLTQYKLFQEFVCIAYILIIGIIEIWKVRAEKAKRGQIILLGSSFSLFLAVFAITEYISSVASGAAYTTSLYGLFVLPLFLFITIFSIVKFEMFELRRIGTQLLVYVLVIMVATQFLFLENSTNRILNSITLILSIGFAYLLVKNIGTERNYLTQIEKLAKDLQLSNEGQSNLIHIMNHQIKGYLSKSRNIFAELRDEPEYGTTEAAKHMIKEGFESLTEGVGFVQQVLNGSSAETGTLIYAKNRFDMRELVEETIKGQRASAEKAGLTYESKIDDGDYKMIGDNVQIKECVRNLIDNSICYTKQGGLKIHLSRNDAKVLFTIEDTGIGIAPEDKIKLFTKGGRGKDSLRYNINSTGYGLAFVKAVVEAHKGRVWVDSKGTNHGSTFYMELPVINA